MAAPRIVTLKEGEEEQLKNLVRKYQASSFIRRRLEAIRYLWRGKSKAEVVAILRCNHTSLNKWIEVYESAGLEGLVKNSYYSENSETQSEVMGVSSFERVEEFPLEVGIVPECIAQTTEEIIKSKLQQAFNRFDSRTRALLRECAPIVYSGDNSWLLVLVTANLAVKNNLVKRIFSIYKKFCKALGQLFLVIASKDYVPEDFEVWKPQRFLNVDGIAIAYLLHTQEQHIGVAPLSLIEPPEDVGPVEEEDDWEEEN
ncbi:MAG: helix-turn-helix domain-containing protein [Scytonema sp. PMC 1069.18]|nr:helix-turn-helix domain-containing protein [Scytonema sp. PMC 1069.18]MEC4881044.1 helix-turn-helix domain-containing protein [Scytonema sp. PMC 1070.18]